jgi:hypothetical protein
MLSNIRFLRVMLCFAALIITILTFFCIHSTVLLQKDLSIIPIATEKKGEERIMAIEFSKNGESVSWERLFHDGFIPDDEKKLWLEKKGLSREEVNEYYNVLGGRDIQLTKNLPIGEDSFHFTCGEFLFSASATKDGNWEYTLRVSKIEKSSSQLSPITETMPKHSSQKVTDVKKEIPLPRIP